MTSEETLRDLIPGRYVCVVGHGEAAPIHRHVCIKRTTKTLVVVSRIVNGWPVETRYRFDGREADGGRTVAAPAAQCPHKTS